MYSDRHLLISNLDQCGKVVELSETLWRLKLKKEAFPQKTVLHVGSHAVCMCIKHDLNAETCTHPCGRQFSSIPEVPLLQEQLVLSETASPTKASVNQGSVDHF